MQGFHHVHAAKRAAILSLVGALAFAASTAHAALLVNGTFNADVDANNRPDGWDSFGYGPTGFADSKPGTGGDAFAVDGTRYINMGNYGVAGTSGGGWYQTNAGIGGHSYTLTVDSATENYGSPTGEMRLIFIDAGGTELARNVLHTADNAPNKPYANYSLTAIAPATAGQVKVEFATFGDVGTLLFDNAVLTDVTAVPEPTTLAGLTLAVATFLRRRRR